MQTQKKNSHILRNLIILLIILAISVGIMALSFLPLLVL